MLSENGTRETKRERETDRGRDRGRERKRETGRESRTDSERVLKVRQSQLSPTVQTDGHLLVEVWSMYRSQKCIFRIWELTRDAPPPGREGGLGVGSDVGGVGRQQKLWLIRKTPPPKTNKRKVGVPVNTWRCYIGTPPICLWKNRKLTECRQRRQRRKHSHTHTLSLRHTHTSKH